MNSELEIRVLDVVRLEGTVIELRNGQAVVEITGSQGRGIAFPEVPVELLTLIRSAALRGGEEAA